MGQVPTYSSYLIVGGGRLARHLAAYFDSIEVSYSQWNRKTHNQRQLTEGIESQNCILLAISDDQISDFYNQHNNPEKTWIHFSGAFSHPEIVGFHPLMTFSQELYPLDTYSNMSFVGSAPQSEFSRLFPKLPNSYYCIDQSHRAFYHSLCVLSGNGTTSLWEQVGQSFADLGLPRQAWIPYLKQIASNIIEESPGRLTGPWYRGDEKTVQSNQDSLKNHPFLPLYQELRKLSYQKDGLIEQSH